MGTIVTAGMVNGEEGTENLTNADTLNKPPDEQDTAGRPPKEEIPEGMQPPPDGQGFGEEHQEDKPKPFKYKTHEEAEKGAAEATRKLHDLSTENAQLKKQLEEIQARETTGKENQQPPMSKYDQERERITKDTIAQDNKLDTNDPEYDAKRTELWANFTANMAKIAAQEVQEADKQAQEDLKAINTAINAALKTADLDKIPGIHELFDAHAAKADRKLTLQQQIDWAVSQCKATIDNLKGHQDSRRKEQHDTTSKFDVLPRGARPNQTQVKSDDNTSKTMGEARKAALDRRRLKK